MIHAADHDLKSRRNGMSQATRAIRNERSLQLWEEAERLIIGGGQGHKRPVSYMQHGGPAFIVRADGSRFWDVDGNEYVDFLLAYGPILLGHSDSEVNAAVERQIREGVIYSVEHPFSVLLARKLVEIIPAAEMVQYFVGGSSATAGAVRLARAHTGRERIIRCGYHGWLDWTQPGCAGVPGVMSELVLGVDYDNVDQIEDLLRKYPGEVAALMIEAVQGDGPSEGYFDAVRRLADEHGAVFILDEVKTGFRFALGGAQERFGIDPDLSCFGKAMCNGYPGAVVVGKRAFMEKRTDVHLAATFHADLLSLVAALIVIRRLQEDNGIAKQWALGERLMGGLNRVFEEASAPLRMVGFPPMPTPRPLEDRPGLMDRFCGALQSRGIYATGHPWFLSLAHTDADIDAAVDAARDAVREALR
jgi:glutamate-1-semialdehyde aminotransferase